jgi:hypothetical protein
MSDIVKKEDKHIANMVNDLSDYLPDETKKELTDTQIQSLNKYSDSTKFGITGVAPIICKDEACVYLLKCPLFRAGIARPIHKDCPVEEFNQKRWLEQFANASGINIEDMTESAYDMMLLEDLANYQLLEFRAIMELAENPRIHIREVSGIDHLGNEMVTSHMNQVINFKEKMAKTKMKILRELIATRKAKSEEQASFRDRSSAAAEMIARVKQMKEKVIDADYEVKDG